MTESTNATCKCRWSVLCWGFVLSNTGADLCFFQGSFWKALSSGLCWSLGPAAGDEMHLIFLHDLLSGQKGGGKHCQYLHVGARGWCHAAFLRSWLSMVQWQRSLLTGLLVSALLLLYLQLFCAVCGMLSATEQSWSVLAGLYCLRC